MVDFFVVSGLHVITGLASLKPNANGDPDGWIKVAAISEMENSLAKIVRPNEGEAIAVFRHGDKITISVIQSYGNGPVTLTFRPRVSFKLLDLCSLGGVIDSSCRVVRIAGTHPNGRRSRRPAGCHIPESNRFVPPA